MDTKALRQKVLDLAIRGKLVSQDPNDEPASVLLERIRAEKQRLVKEGKLKAKDIKNDTIIFVGDDNLHYEKFADGSGKCIEDEIPFDLPEGWAWVRLQNICTMANGTAKRNGSDGIQTTVLRLADLGESEIFFSDTRSVILTDSDISKYSLSAGDILFVRVDGSKENVGKSYYFEGQSFPVAYCDHLIRCTPANVMHGKLLSMFMRCGYVRQLIGERMVSAAGQNTISQPSLGTILLPIPPLNEQDRIIQKLGDADTFVSQIFNSKQELSETIDCIKAKILDLAIRGQLVPQDPSDEPASVLLERIREEKENLIQLGKIKRDKKESIIFRGDDNSYYEKVDSNTLNIDAELPFEVPDTWTWCRFSEVIELFSGQDLTPDRYSDIPEGIPYITGASNLEDGQVLINRWTTSATTHATIGDLLLTVKGSGVGKMAICNIIDAHIARQIMALRCRTGIVQEYLRIVISAFITDITEQANGIIPGIRREVVLKSLFPLPPYAEQHRIVEKMHCVVQKLHEIEKGLN